MLADQKNIQELKTPERYERVVCPNDCSAQAIVLHDFEPFQVCRCCRCGLVYLNPRIAEDQLGTLYEAEYFHGGHDTGYATYERDRPLYEKTFRRRLTLVQKFKRSGRLLDIGCGFGYLLNVAQTLGFEPWGLDVSSFAVERCNERFPGRVKRGILTPDTFPPASFDVITMFDLIEHVYHPVDFFRLVATCLKDDGIVAVTTPNHDSLLSRVSGRNWVSYKIPEHVFYYSPKTLAQVAAPLFRVVRVRSEGQYCTLAFLAERLKTLNATLGASVSRLCRGKLGNLPVYVNSGSMTVLLEKQVNRS